MPMILTNDDGFDAPGLEALKMALRRTGALTVVAPDAPQSGIGHRVTTAAQIEVTRVENNRYRVRGTPADCSRIALKKIAPGSDWLIAGINPGANLGSDIYHSGTVAAAREAAILGCRSIALSQYISAGGTIDWQATQHHAGKVLKVLLDRPLPARHFWNVNLPHPISLNDRLSIEFCGLDTCPHRYDFNVDNDRYLYQGSIHDRPREPGKDVAVCFDQGNIAVTCIPLGV
jgi:5'-nucleotidase